MAKEKRITVKDLLNLMKKEDHVVVFWYAYAFYYIDTDTEQKTTVEEILENTKYDCLNAKVFNITINSDEFYEYVVIHAEMVA